VSGGPGHPLVGVEECLVSLGHFSSLLPSFNWLVVCLYGAIILECKQQIHSCFQLPLTKLHAALKLVSRPSYKLTA